MVHERKVTGTLLLSCALILLTTCQLQFNKNGNGLTLRLLIPQTAAGGTKGVPVLGTDGKSLTNATTVEVTISQGSATIAQQTVSIGGKTSVDVTFSLSTSGSYNLKAVMLDAGGDILAQATTNLAIPTGTPLVILPLNSSLLYNTVFSDSNTRLTKS